MLYLGALVAPVMAGTIRVPEDYAKIQDAVKAASDGDVIFVKPSTYYEEIVVDKSVKIISKPKGAVVDAADTTYGRPFMIIAAHVTIDGFTIRAGHQWCCNTGIPIIIGAVFPGDERYLGDAHHVTIRSPSVTLS